MCSGLIVKMMVLTTFYNIKNTWVDSVGKGETVVVTVI